MVFEYQNILKKKQISPTMEAPLIRKIAQRLFKLSTTPTLYIQNILLTEPLNIYLFEETELYVTVVSEN